MTTRLHDYTTTRRIIFVAFTVFLLTLQAIPCFAEAAISRVQSNDFQAGMLPSQWDRKVQEAAPLPHGEGNGLKQLQVLVIDNIAQIIRYALISISVLYIFVDILILVIGSSDDATVTAIKSRGGYYVLGFMLMGLSSELVKIFDPIYLHGSIGNIPQIKHTGQYVINYFSLISGAIAVFYMLIAALRMITAQGDDGIISEEKKSFQFGFIGLIVIMMADVMINKVFYPTDVHVPAAQETLSFAQEIFGMAAYFLEFMAVVAIGSLVLAGGYYITALGDDGQTEKAKIILKNIALGFILIAFAYTFVSAVSPDITGQVTVH